jgi:hypothetical protein
MTPKEKAQEIVEQMSDFIPRCDHNEENLNIETIIRCAKQCALIAVDLAIELNDFHIEFLQEVKQEIEKL